MDNDNNFIYSIQGFFPPAFKEEKLPLRNQWAFGVKLDRSITHQLLETPMPYEIHEKIQEAGKRLIKASGLGSQPSWNPELEMNPYEFINLKGDRTFLLRSCQVPGGASLEIKDEEIPNLRKISTSCLEYHPYGVSRMDEAYTLLSTWLGWIEAVKTSLK